MSIAENENKGNVSEVRLTRAEMTTMFWLYSALNSTLYAKDDLTDRLDMVPRGHERLLEVIDILKELVNDLTLTVPEKQKSKIRNIMTDMEIRMVPKAAPKDVRLVLDKEEARVLVDSAQDLCKTCVKDGTECLQCELHNVLTAILPLENYGLGALCPYNLAEWEG